jgi:oxygen-independent coproporphyrinogen III oxidase
MSGIYIHIPFCLQACHYCDFHFSTSLKNKEAFLNALRTEMLLRKSYLSKPEKIETIYFGGGTPSLLNNEELLRIFDTLFTHYEVDAKAEITLEANPEDLSKEKISSLKNTPINRFSIGVQSFFDSDLKFMNRAHSAQKAISAVKTAQDAGFENITIDLIYGTPTLTDENWKSNLHTAFELDVKHISAYCLTVEEKTALNTFIKTGKVKNVDEEQSAQQFEILVELMKQNNFIQYEISNFAQADFFSQHNSNYWKQKEYIGFGPSAHSYDGASRQWNIRNNSLYIQELEKGKLNFEKEVLTTDQNFNEYIMTSLRTIWGTDLKHIEKRFGTLYLEHLIKESKKYVSSKHLNQHNSLLQLSEAGKLIADKIASDLFYISKA